MILTVTLLLFLSGCSGDGIDSLGDLTKSGAAAGYNVLLVRFGEDGQPAGSEVFAEGWLQGQTNWGRPNDVLQMPDGSLLVSDDQMGAIYRIAYTGEST